MSNQAEAFVMVEQLEVGDNVRSFDFKTQDLVGPRAAYVDGQIRDIIKNQHHGYMEYVILVTRDIFGGEEQQDRVGAHVHAPVNGTPTNLGSVTNQVKSLKDCDL